MKGTKRKGRGFVADYYVGTKRVRRSFKTAALRDRHLENARELLRRTQGLSSAVDRSVTVAAFAPTWLAGLEGSVKPRTLEGYRAALELYILPRLGGRLVAELRRADVKAFLVECRQQGVGYVIKRRQQDGSVVEERIRKPLRHGSVYAIYSALRALLNEAVEEEIISGNPAARLGKKLHLHATTQHRKAAVAARVLSRERLRLLLEYARTKVPAAYPLVLTLARAGLRVGELVALQLDDYEPEARKLLVARSWDDKHGRMGTPKHGARRVDVSEQLGAILDLHVSGLRKIVGLNGAPRSEWLFPSLAWSMLDPRNVRRLLAQLAAASGLNRTLGPHDLRHTYGSQLTAAGAPPQYIQAQMGHASIQITIDLYGSGLPASYQQGVDVLDDAPLPSRSRRSHAARGSHKPVTSGRLLAKGGGVSD